jgi:DNA-binding HxlR family transcriptional regulator
MAAIEALEKPRAIEIILYLLENTNRDIKLSDVYQDISGGNETHKARLDEFTSLGLVEERKLEQFPYSTIVKLTKEGSDVAKHLNEVQKLLLKNRN